MMSPLEKLKGDVDVLIPGDPNLALMIKGLLVEAFDEGVRQLKALNDDTEEQVR